ncbi:hypothetical protein GGS23DRAFT_562754 [Durotheca rogersii]|uniref:uncharacterized protein n=1 Tax=Durotheca rogersii TaxID=419775 RepID=UPI002220D0BE|nr:uncharacterized protein GGS23DRAFT_562754 [Durotheca rogersii]KAI5864067.1 hypothetical protein GGS23DRAFT_562754 [Durotheca rogersii]
MSIQQLPEDVIAQIKSSTTVISLNAVVCGLVKNSLDADATKITVSIDYARGNCSVEDNGLGIPPYEFKPAGGLAKLHHTSKSPPRNHVHGRYGTFLASAAGLSLLSVTSHHHEYHSHNSIQIRNAAVLARHTPSLPEQRLLSFPHGTRVTVRDLFGSMPVRVKQRAIDAERGAHARDWERLRRALVALLLAWPGHVSLSVRDSVDRRSLAIRIPEESSGLEGEKGGSLSLAARVSRTLFQAQLSDDNCRDAWVPLQATAGQTSIVGAVSLVPIASRHIQFISLGVRPVSNDHGSNVLYEEINRLFTNSSFGVLEQAIDLNEDKRDQRAKDRRFKTDGYTNQELRGRKGVDRWPMFYIRINLGDHMSQLGSYDADDIFHRQDESLRGIVDLLRATLYEFLKAHHLRPRYCRPTSDPSPRGSNAEYRHEKSLPRSLTPRAQLRTTQPHTSRDRLSSGDLASTRLNLTPDSFRRRPESPFDLWTRIKSGQPQYAHLYEKPPNQPVAVGHSDSQNQPTQGSSLNNIDTPPKAPLISPDGTLLCIPFTDAEIDAPKPGQQMTPEGEDPDGEQSKLREAEEVLWTNPVTKEVLTVNTRTGFVSRPQRVETREAPRGADHLPLRKRIRTDTMANPRDERSKWLEDLLSSWEDPVFHPREPPIPVAFDEAKALALVTRTSKGDCHGCNSRPLEALQSSHSVESRLSKEHLRNAEVVGQVDRKFIFARVPLSSQPVGSSTQREDTSLLIVIDQHAADERCQVEALMKDYFTVAEDAENTPVGGRRLPVVAQMETLEQPLVFDISAQDCHQFQRSVAFFQHWGIAFQIDPAPKSKSVNEGQARLKVYKLPSSIAERCCSEPRLLIELLRREVWGFAEQGVFRHTAGEAVQLGKRNSEELHWLSRFHGCPQGILDMINSRACRSSIMFNDPLSREECVDLVERLAACALPFQCAHSRPSIVPLADLGAIPINITSFREPENSGFGEAFKKWQARSGGG